MPSCTRREFGQLALASLPMATLLGRAEAVLAAFAAKPNSVFDGVQIGTITYSYRSMPDQSADATLKYIVDSGISGIELMGGPVESFAGAPPAAAPGGGRGAAAGGGRGAERAPAPAAAVPRGTSQPAGQWNGQACEPAAAPGAGRGAGRGRGDLTPDQQAAQQEQARKLKAWRTSVSMDPFKKLRRMYNDAGVTIY